MPRTTGITDEKFRRWIASQYCMICGQCFISQAAHLEWGGMGIKGCDSSVRPLCADTSKKKGCNSKLDQNKIKIPFDLRHDIMDAPVYHHWKRGNIQEAQFQIYKFRDKLCKYM